ncbi:MAG: polyprenol phosphomannose-dependent alpha 1,6 mannosyltransferase MptB, partial [Fimbriimonadaceae bacterium]|nr:polyprenol phosphomannose-dependent alpha 1,6 mannosyltransferase MptB [Chitinophagales bacterium]
MIPQTATKTISRVAVYIFFTAALIALNYFTPRTNFVQLIILYSFLFVAYLHIIFYWKDDKHIKEAKFVSVALRFLLLFSIPNLSDDFYRYIWDGSLMHHGINPFTYTPQQLLNDPSLHQAAVKISDGNIYEHLNSEQYYSVYPPVGQFFFFITAKICHLTKGGLLLNIFILKFFILLSEIGTIYFLSKILNHLNFSSKNILLYALNPLIILELTGNIHFEAVTIFFLAASIYFLLKHRYFLSAVLFGLSVATKILPLILLPFLLKYIGFRKTIVYSSITAIVFIISFIPFYNAGLIRHFLASLQLYFASFEF